MTLIEFLEMAEAVLALVPDAGEVEHARLVERMLKSNRIYMPSEQALVDESARQNREMTEAVKLAAAGGIHVGVGRREPS